MEPKNDNQFVVTTPVPSPFSPTMFPNGPMTCVKLNETNYVLWSRSVQVFLKGTTFEKYLVDTKPKEDTIGYDQWEDEDAQIISLVLNNMECATLSTGSSGIDRGLSIDNSALVVSTGHNDSTQGGRDNCGGLGSCTGGQIGSRL
ncbi:unnamed protein product [Ilex paraguariensis]|uniref:Retrotransposon Copia-like N-terminal domain-containing protein n=1 Tax=Ilex paraguariensis TaxID=185542 RepID=A0ABC8US92_9AQUA